MSMYLFTRMNCVNYFIYLFMYNRFRAGLQTLGVFERIQACPERFYSVFCGPVERMTAESMFSLFTARFSEEEENQAREHVTLGFWKQYLQECEGIYFDYIRTFVIFFSSLIFFFFFNQIFFRVTTNAC